MHGSKTRTGDGLYDNRKDGSGYSSSKREWNSQTHSSNDDSSKSAKRIRTQSSSYNRSASSSSCSQQQRQNGDKEKKSVKDTKKPLRVSGDWSEFKSSTGKTYFYNSKTEVSQWEKPKGWPTDESTSSSTRSNSSSISTDRTKKEPTHSSTSPTVHSRCKMDEPSKLSRLHSKDTPTSNSNVKHHQNGHFHPQKSNNSNHDSSFTIEPSQVSSNNPLPSPVDDGSRMSFSSTSSQEAASVSISNRNGCGLPSTSSESVTNSVSDSSKKPMEKVPTTLNGNETKPIANRSISLPATSEQSMEIEPTTPVISKAERDHEIQKYYRGDLIRHLTDWPSTQLEKQCVKLFDDYYAYNAKTSMAFIELKAMKSNFRVLEIKRSILIQKLHRCQQQIKEREDDKLL